MVTENKWKKRKLPEGVTESLLNDMAEACGVTPLTASIMARRGCLSSEDGMAYLDPQFEDLHDPFLLPDMEIAAKRLLLARENGETVCVYGDYDADGTTAAAILLKYFSQIGLKAFFRIPNRLTEGYGMNLDAVAAVIERGADLILTVDNGIASEKEIRFCQEKSIDVIVTDHHECQGELPPALAVIDAKRPDSQYPFSELCGAGVAFKLIQAIDASLGLSSDMDEFLECAALATVADIVPLKDENRTMVRLGLQTMNAGALNPGIAALIAVSELENITAGNLGYVIAPKINAAGRLENADEVLNLYLSADFDAALPVAKHLKAVNEQRQAIEQEITQAAVYEVETSALWQNDFLVVSGQNWHSGVIGIAASKLQEQWYHPTIVIGIDEKGLGKGSCRSIPGVDIFQALSSCKTLFDSFGGHEQAAGFSIQEKHIPELKAALEKWGKDNQVAEHCTKTMYYDGEITPEDIDMELLEELAYLEPCGIGNPGPVFKMKIPRAKNAKTLGAAKNHLSFSIENIRCVGFGLGEKLPVILNGNSEVLCRIRENVFRGERSVQPAVIDVKRFPLNDNRQCWEWVRELRCAETFSDTLKTEALWDYPIEALIPDHAVMVMIYRCFSEEKILAVKFDDFRNRISELNSFQLLITVNAMQELGFIDFKIKDGVIYGKKNVNPEKKSIQTASIVVKLKQYYDLMKRG